MQPPCNAPETVFTETPARSAMSESDTVTILTSRVGERSVARGDNLAAGRILAQIDNPQILSELKRRRRSPISNAGTPASARRSKRFPSLGGKSEL
jgi:multidrug efflux pump subunit AcrA (membrane-fusion protein)